MKKLLLILLVLGIINVSYASFPVNQDAKIEIVETIKSPIYENSSPILGVLSLTLSVVGLILIFTPILGTGFVMILSAIILGIIGLFYKSSRILSIVSILLSLISLLIGLIIVSMLAMGGVGLAFGG